ncbi:phosphotransferase family protein [Pseudomonas borbori]|uniref:Predicted kinase, aminoglycoside phosphotransferase (APT) family n=1 Tax=Pseudomonas borbori TaxID=289003 RepID=A0A1I5XB86_9PSED|nr:phosphotransferase family protein [Pseudomonas borbori]SFQ29106.1 Predicted kinase, aminoglycoside phosphotransferase (APT) family [Pseudomonas borbori]
MQRIDKNHPTQEWISSLRRRFTTEAEVDRVLTRRLERRAGPGYTSVPLPTLVSGVESLLNAKIGSAYSVTNARWLSGGASKLQMAFTLTWDRPGMGPEQTRMVLRMEPAESIVETSRLREFQLVKAFEGIVPVPTAFWCDADAEHLPYPSMIYGFSDGVAKPTNSSSGVSGVGTRLPEQLRHKLGPQFVEHLSTIHLHDFENAALSAFDIPTTGTTQCSEWGVNTWDRIWEEDHDEDVPVLRVASAWLRRNMPILDRPSIVHADYRTGNFLFTENDAKITALLDWELGRIGDRHQDLAWTTHPAFGGLAEDGKTFLVGGLMTESEFLEAYEHHSGLKVNPRTLHWYRVYNSYMLAVLNLATTYRIARNGKTHQDVLVGWLIGISYMFQDDVRMLIEKGY